MSSTELSVWAAIVAAFAAVFAAMITGVLGLVGVFLTVQAQRAARRDRRRERVRDAYVRWQADLNWLTELEQRAILLRKAAEDVKDHPALLESLGQHMERAAGLLPRVQHAEITSFARLMFVDFGSAELEHVVRIRAIAPGKSVLLDGREMPSHDRFLELEVKQATELGLLAKNVHRRFSGL